MFTKALKKMPMNFYYLKLAFRSIKKNILFSFINIFGLGIGLAACILIFAYLSIEWNYDTFHPDFEKVYRVKQNLQREGVLMESATTFSSVGPELKQNYPGVKESCRIHRLSGNIAVKYEDQVYRENKLLGVDTSFFNIFNFPFIYGEASSALSQANSVIVSKSLAQKYFADANPIGKELIIHGAYGTWTSAGYVEQTNYIVSGVIDDLPINTHLEFDILISFKLFSNLERELRNWGDGFYTYIKINDESQLDRIAGGMASISDQYRSGQDINLELQKMQGIHLSSNLVNEIKVNGNAKLNWLLLGVAFILLLVAGTNYINFSTARSFYRKDEIGIRKIFGANQKQLFHQLLWEAFALNALSLLLAFFLLKFTEPISNQLIGYSLMDGLGGLTFWLINLGALGIATLITGLYPAYLISKLKSDNLIKGNKNSLFSKSRTRNSLLVFQFAVSILVIGCTLTLFQQMSFMQNKDLGLELGQTLAVNGPSVNNGNDSLYFARLSNFKTEALKFSNIKNVTSANFIPGQEIRGEAQGYVRKVGTPEENANAYSFTQIDFDFIPNFDIEIIAGRAFDDSYALDRTPRQTVIINREACRLLGFESIEEAIGQKIVYRINSTPTIVGVVENFHQYSLQRNFQPIIFEARKTPKAFYYLKFSSQIAPEQLNALRISWAKIFPGNPFNYFFLDDFYDQQYYQESRFLKAFSIFSILAVLISALGLLGLVYFIASSKIKEIGIRKTLGAGFWDIYLVLGKGFSKFMLLSGLIGIPFIYYFSNEWLAEFAFRIDISWWMLLTPLLLLTFITLTIITLQSIWSYRKDPVISLREK